MIIRFDYAFAPVSPFYNITTSDPTLAAALDQVEAAEFIAFDPSFLDIIGTSAKVERILAFPGVEHVHEAPVYVPETNELVFSDTSSIGWLYAINADTYVVSVSSQIAVLTSLSNIARFAI